MAKPQSSSAFQTAYHSLNPQQKLAVDTLEGPVMVIAGPGTGKTQILSVRIANILRQTDTDPSAILALTFTDSGATAMRQRLFHLIGPTAYRLHVSTFHSFASSLISEFPDQFIYSSNAQPATDLQRYQILTQILHDNDFHKIKPANSPLYYLQTGNALPSAIANLKREGVSPARLKELLDEELKDLEAAQDALKKTEFEKRSSNLFKNLDLFQVYSLYQDELKKRHLFDFDDMINWVLDQLQAPDSQLLPILQERFHYLLVDEYQDTNSAQNQIVDLLASFWGDRANLFVVGDDEQSIYRFQGASLENALNFKKTYPSAQIITLTHNYRSQPLILAAARSLIERNTHNLQSTFPDINRHLQSTVDYPEKKLTLASFPSEIFERSYLATQVRALLDQQVSPSQIAIIVNTNAEIAPLSQVFSHFQLPHQTTSDQDLLTTPVIRYLLKLFSVIAKSRSAVDDLDLFTLLHYPFLKVDSFTLLTHARAAAIKRLPLFDYLRQEKTDLTPLLEKIAHWNTLDSILTFTEFFETILQESGLLNWALATLESSQHLRHLSSLFDFVKQLNAADHELNLVAFLSTIDLWQSNRLHIDTPAYNLSPDKITLTTAHKAKGQEWEHVFVSGCIDGRWGNKSNRQLLALPTHILRSDQDHDPLEDERRLFYVALTRAKKTLTLTYSQEILSYHRLRQTLPSQFLAELPENLLAVHQPQPDTEQIDQLLRTLITPSPPTTISDTEAEFIRSILADFKLSVTALDTYLDCPYKFKLNNLFKVPKAKASYLSFGTAVHSALEKFFRHHHQHHRFPDHQFLLDRFEEALKAEVLSPSDYRQRLLQGKQILRAYYDLHLKEARPALETEKYFGSHYHPIFLDDIPLSGKVDRIDWLDPQQKTVTVVDYKTGKPATRGQIEGHTQDSDGRLKRQLVFYKLLSDLDAHFPYTVTAAQLDFVGRPHADKKSGKESFSITPQEIADLKALIKSTMAQIRSLNFPRTTDTSICSRCEFIDHCWPQGLELT